MNAEKHRTKSAKKKRQLSTARTQNSNASSDKTKRGDRSRDGESPGRPAVIRPSRKGRTPKRINPSDFLTSSPQTARDDTTTPDRPAMNQRPRPRVKVKVEPATACVRSSGSTSVHNIFNPTKLRLAFKVNPPSDDEYHLEPAFGLIDSGENMSFEVTHVTTGEGAAKEPPPDAGKVTNRKKKVVEREVDERRQMALLVNFVNADTDLSNVEDYFSRPVIFRIAVPIVDDDK